MEKLERNDSKISLYIPLKNAVAKKVRLRIWVYPPGENLYVFGRDGLTLHHETYSVPQKNDDFLE